MNCRNFTVKNALEIKILLINNSEYLLECHDLFISDNKLCIITDYIDNDDVSRKLIDGFDRLFVLIESTL